jgi:uncharacterized repeat protein (TIGR01451 family)
MNQFRQTGKPLRLALALIAALGSASAFAQSTKDEQFARMSELQAQIASLKGQSSPEAQQQSAAAAAEFAQISNSMGGDRPCATGEQAAAPGAGGRAAPPSPTGCLPTLVSFSNTTPVAIPTGPGVVTSTINVAGAQTYLWDVDVTTFITHTFSADLDITIQSPAGTVVTLTTDNGGSNDDVFNGTVWDDSANPLGQVPYTSNNGLVTDQLYANLTLASPLVPEEALAAFVGEDPNGTWTITISDDLAGDGGNLSQWSLDLTTFASAPIQSAVQTFTQATPVNIPTGPGVVTSTLDIAGLASPMCKVIVHTNLTHTFAADLDITLTSPTGTVVTLTTDNGAGNDNVFAGTVWDDAANPAGQVPYASNNGMVTDQVYANLTLASPLVAEESMGAFMGEDGNGTWTLTISDDLAGDGGDLSDWSLDVVTCTCASADLSITLTDAPDPVPAGTNLTYTATVTNNGPTDAQDVVINLPLPAGTSFVSATPSAGGVCNAASPVLCTFAGATASAGVVSVDVVAAVPAAAVGALSATATTTSTTNDPDPSNNSATADTAISVQADLSMALTDAPDPVTAGANLTYTATVTNNGPSDATGVTITLPLPANTSFVSGSVAGGGSCAGAPVVCSVTGNMVPGSSRVATITLAVSGSAPSGSSISATATAGSVSTDPNPGNNSATTSTAVITSADLVLSFSASALQVLVNEPVTFTATSLNQGPSDAQNVSITITLTPDFRYSGHTPSAGASCTTPQVGTTGAITCTWAGATAVGATRSLQVVAFSNSQGSTAVNASTTSGTTDPVANNNLGNISVQVGFLVEGIPSNSTLGLALLALTLGLLGLVAVRRQY